MKTINSLLQAAPLARLLIIGWATRAAAPGNAAPKPGGGTSRSTGGGTTYYVGPWAAVTNGAREIGDRRPQSLA